MTLLPHENHDVKGLDGPAFPRYKVAPVCCVPGCSKFTDHAHHLWRRSFLGGDFCWVELWDHKIIGNLVGLCYRHHEQVTRGEVWMRWNDVDVVWDDNSVKYPPPIFPQPPAHGEPIPQSDKSLSLGPASRVICPGCKRPLPHEKIEGQKRDPTKRRKTWTVKVPDDGEDGALVLDTLLEGCRDLFQHGEEENVRYFTIAQALAWVVQHGHLLTES